MRKILLLACLTAAYVTIVRAQADPHSPAVVDTASPYLKNPALPAFNIMELDSATIFNTYNIPKGNTTALVLFDPDCKHCQHTMQRLVAGMDSVKNVQFYLVSLTHSIQRLRSFYQEYHLADYKNIVKVGRDYEFFFISFYRTRSFPVIVLYDKKKKLIALKEGTFNATDVYNMLH